jgi:hypothetical protein
VSPGEDQRLSAAVALRELHQARYLRVVTWSRLVCFVSVVLLVGGCGSGGIDRDPYVRKNQAILKSLPAYPGAVRVKVAHYEARCCGQGDHPGPVVGYGTHVDYRVHAGVRPKVVSAFYRRRLKGWRVVRRDSDPAYALRFVRGKASVGVDMEDLRPNVRDNPGRREAGYSAFRLTTTTTAGIVPRGSKTMCRSDFSHAGLVQGPYY